MQVVQEKIYTVDGTPSVKKYMILQKIGEGAFSKCFKVQVVGTDKIYAMKVISKDKMKLLQKQKLVSEIQIHQSLHHQSIVFLDHWFEDDKHQYIFLEYCPNKTLQEKCKRFEGADEKVVRKFGLQIVQALKYLHSKRVLHRDLKLANFFLGPQDQVKLGDFGFACKLQSQLQLKREACGTPNYAAPQIIGGFGYSYPADVWSLGAILYRLKYGLCPFEMQQLKDTLRRIKTADYVFPRWTSISDQLQDLIKRILVVDYDARLTLPQIESHPFFKKDESGGIIHKIVRLFSSDRPDVSIDKRRNDSCQNRKDIKKILKDRTQSTPNLKVGGLNSSGLAAKLAARKEKPSSPTRSQRMQMQKTLRSDKGLSVLAAISGTRQRSQRSKARDLKARDLTTINTTSKKKQLRQERLYTQPSKEFNDSKYKALQEKVLEPKLEVTFKPKEIPKVTQFNLKSVTLVTQDPSKVAQFQTTDLSSNNVNNILSSPSMFQSSQCAQPPKPSLGVSEKPSERIARITNKFKHHQQNSIVQRYASYLVYQLEYISDHYIVYLTNGIRQILKDGQTYIPYNYDYCVDRDGLRLAALPKTIEYIVKQKLKESKFKITQQAFLSVIQKRHFISKWRFLDGRIVFNLNNGTLITVANSNIFYLKTPQQQYLYNTKLQIITEEAELSKNRIVYQQYMAKLTKTAGRSVSRNRKLLQ